MVTLFIIIPLAAAFVIWVTGVFTRKLCDFLANVSCVALVVIAFTFLMKLRDGAYMPIVYGVGGWTPPVGISMVIDGLSMMTVLIVNIVALCAVIFSVAYMEKYTDKVKYYTLFMLMLAGMNGLVISGDLFNMFVFLEIATIASAALVAFGTEHEELEASFRYLVLGSVASMMILLGIAMLYGHTSTLNLADMSVVLANSGNVTVIKFVGVLFLMGFGLKSAIVPFHAWLPDAHPSAPAPISAMLSGVLIKSLGVYALVRLTFNVMGMGC